MSSMQEITCRHCGGPISLNQEWDRTADSFRSSDWTTQYCVMCGGSMTLYRRWIDPPKAHSHCLDGGWHDQPCNICFGPMAIPPGTEIVPTSHRRCVPENWYERTCEACQEPLRVHVDWDEAPTVHRRCESQQWYEKQCKYCTATLKVHVDWETTPDAHDSCQSVAAVGIQACAPNQTVREVTSEIVLATIAEATKDNTPEIVDHVITNGSASKEITLYAEPEPAAETETASEEPETEILIANEPGPKILIERNGSVERDVELADTQWESFNQEMSKLTEPAEQPLEHENRHEYSCTGCGEHIVRLDGTLPERKGLCRKCKNDELLVNGAVAALRKRFPGDLNVAVETKTRVISEKIVVVSNVETDEVLAEVMLCDDGVFSSERAAVAYDPQTEERFSKTVFGQKGLFSSLLTTDTFDCDGTLIQKTRPGRELPLAATNEGDEPHAVRMTNNRFFLKQK